MKKILLLLFIAFKISSIQSQTLSIFPKTSNVTWDDTVILGSPKRNYYFLKELNGVIQRSTFDIVIRNFSSLSFSTTDIITIQIHSVTEHGGTILYRKDTVVGTNVWLKNVNIDSLGSGVYQISVVNKSRGNMKYDFKNIALITEKKETFLINNCRYMITYVDDFFKVPASLLPIRNDIEKINARNIFISQIKRSLEFAWNYQITRWKIGNLTKPFFTDSVYQIFISCTGDLSINPIVYRKIDDVYSSADDNTRAIWFPVNAKRNLGATTTLDDSTFFKEVVGHEFFHGLQFSVMKYSKIKAAHPDPADCKAELEKRKWLIEGQARFLETVLMDSIKDSKGRNAAYIINSMEQDYSSDCKQFLTRTINNVITQITKQQYV